MSLFDLLLMVAAQTDEDSFKKERRDVFELQACRPPLNRFV